MSINDPRAYSPEEIQAMLCGLSVHRIWFDGNAFHANYIKRQTMYRDDLEKTQPLPKMPSIDVDLGAEGGNVTAHYITDGLTGDLVSPMWISNATLGLIPWLESNQRRSSKEFREAEAARAYNKIMAHLRALGGVSSSPN